MEPAPAEGTAAPGRAASPGGTSLPGSDGQSGSAGQPGSAALATGAPRKVKYSTKAPWQVNPDGSTVFRMPIPVAGWWIWVVFAVVCLGDLAVQGRDRASLSAVFVVIAITGIMYACALRPKVIADQDGILVLNPIRDHRAPWQAVTGIALGDSVEVKCARPGPEGDKTIYSWALYTRRRAAARAELRGRNRGNRRSAGAAGFAMLHGNPPAADKSAPAELMAGELRRLANQARQQGAADGAVTASWAWRPIAAMLVPVIAVIATVLIR